VTGEFEEISVERTTLVDISTCRNRELRFQAVPGRISGSDSDTSNQPVIKRI